MAPSLPSRLPATAPVPASSAATPPRTALVGLFGGEGPLAAAPVAAARWALVGLLPVMAMLVLAPWSERLFLKAVSVWGDEALPCPSCLDGVSVPAGCAHLQNPIY